MNINNILVPTDFSDNAMKAAKLAAKIATETNANIMLINGYVKPQGGTSVMVKITDLIAKEAKENMSDFLNSLQEEFPNVTFDGKTSYGYIDEVIQVITQDQPYDLIIMGTTGSDKIQNKVFGSNTSKMIQKSAVPVLSVPSDFSGHELETMVLCVELPLKNKEVLHRFNAISAALGVETKIISMPLKKSVESLQDEIESIKAETNIPVEIVEGTDFFDTLLDYIEKNKIDGIGILRKEYGFFENIFHKSKTKELAIYADKPILAIDI